MKIENLRLIGIESCSLLIRYLRLYVLVAFSVGVAVNGVWELISSALQQIFQEEVIENDERHSDDLMLYADTFAGFFFHILFVKAAVINFTYRAIRRPGITARQWWDSTRFSTLWTSFFSLLSIYFVTLMLCAVIFVPIASFCLFLSIKSAPDAWPVPNLNLWYIYLSLAIPFVASMPLAARLWLAVPSSIIYHHRFSVSIRESIMLSEGKKVGITVLMCAMFLPAIAILVVLMEEIDNEKWNFFITLVVASVVSLFDAIVVTVYYLRLSDKVQNTPETSLRNAWKR